MIVASLKGIDYLMNLPKFFALQVHKTIVVCFYV